MRIINYFLGDKYPDTGPEHKRVKAFVGMHIIVFLLLILSIVLNLKKGNSPTTAIIAEGLLIIDLILIKRGKAKFVGHFLTLILTFLFARKIAFNPTGIEFSVFADSFYILPVIILTTALFSNRLILVFNTTVLLTAVLYSYNVNFDSYPEAVKALAARGIITYVVDTVMVFIISLMFANYMSDSIKSSHQSLNYQELQTKELSQIISNVKQSASEVEEINNQLKRTAESILSGANEQAASSIEVSTSAEVMAESILKSSANAKDAETLARKSVTTMHKSNKAVEQTVKKLYEIIEKTAYINSFAVKTNILALNAAIEAKQAGQYGAGFAVIAQEIRKLAEHSRLASEEINTLVNEGKVTAESSINMLSSAIPDIKGTSDLVQNIAASGREQNSRAAQIGKMTDKLTSVSDKNKKSAHVLSENYKKLNSLTQMLSRAVSKKDKLKG